MSETLYPAALRQIKRIERALVQAFRTRQKGAASVLLGRGARGWLMRLPDTLRPVIVASGKVAWAAGATTAARRLATDHLRFDDKQVADEGAFEMPRRWVEWYEGTLDDALARYADRIRRNIGRLTQQAAQEGRTTAQLTADVEQLVEGLTTWQAERIARTETMRLWNLGHYETFEQSQNISGYSYSVIMDDRTSHICAPLHGRKVRRDDLEFIPPLHPHCRTILEPVYPFDDVADDEWQKGESVKPLKGFGAIPDV